MKTKLLLCLTILTCSLQLLAQTQAPDLSKAIVGTWRMTAQTGKYPDGKPYKPDLTKKTQFKIINPTHFMFVNYNSDSLKGAGNGGAYTLKGDKYVETLDFAKTYFTVKVTGDKFYQDGFLIYPDGTKAELHEVYQRVTEPANMNTDLVGTWNFVSGNDLIEGKKKPVTDLTEMMIFTPQHLMWVHKTAAGKFKEALIASYTREGNTIFPKGIIATWPLGKEKVQVSFTIKGDQMASHGTILMEDGTKAEFEAIHQNAAKQKMAKTVSK